MRALVLLLLGTTAASASPRICDLGDRVIVVDAQQVGDWKQAEHLATRALAGTVTVVRRSNGARASAAITNSHATDHCGGPGGSHAGCSERGGDTIRSTLLGRDVLSLGVHRDYALLTGNKVRPCHDANRDPWLITCATAKRFVAVSRTNTATLIKVYTGMGDEPALVENADVEGDVYAGSRVTLIARSAVIELDGKRENCLAVDRN